VEQGGLIIAALPTHCANPYQSPPSLDEGFQTRRVLKAEDGHGMFPKLVKQRCLLSDPKVGDGTYPCLFGKSDQAAMP
jgi:hypothetical protein